MRNKQDLYVEEFSMAVIVDKDLIILQICAWGFMFSSHFPYKAKKQKKRREEVGYCVKQESDILNINVCSH